jgi:hypothetical protein
MYRNFFVMPRVAIYITQGYLQTRNSDHWPYYSPRKD